MSNLAFATPLREPRVEQQPRHIEIVSTREQRRARPKVAYAVVVVGGLFAIFLAQLLMSIVVSDGAYKISGLQVEQRDLTRQQQALSERLDLLASPQNLATQAESLGMVLGNTSPVFLRLSDGAIVGTESAAGTGASVLAAHGGLVPNALLGDIPLVTPAAPSADTTDTSADGSVMGTADGAPLVSATAPTEPATAVTEAATAGAPTAPSTAQSVSSTPTTLPSPITH